MHKCKRNENKQTYIKDYLELLIERCSSKTGCLEFMSPSELFGGIVLPSARLAHLMKYITIVPQSEQVLV